MTDLERLAFSTAFVAAVVVVGLAFSLVPYVELITLVVFCAGVLLGPRTGAFVGALGMGVYHFANSAFRGFPPSIPYLVPQIAGMSLVGVVGGWWRAWWLAGGIPRRAALLALPVAGVLLTAIYHVLLNGVSAVLFTEPGKSRIAYFLSGMAFSLGDIVSNALIFALAGPVAVHTVRRAARSRNWWRTPAAVFVLGSLWVGVAGAQTWADSTAVVPAGGSAPVDTVVVGAADTTGVTGTTTSAADTTTGAADTTTAGAGSSARAERTPADPVLWPELPHAGVAERGAPGFLEGPAFPDAERSRRTGPAVAPALDRWALGWGRVRVRYDGMPLDGPVHGFGEPPDIPLAWDSTWRERWSATGTDIEIEPPPPASDKAASQIILTTGSLNRHSGEFALFRGVGGVDLGVDFLDREESDVLFFSDVDLSRLWVRLASRGRSRWSVDLSNGIEERTLYLGGDLGRESRRLQASWRSSDQGAGVRGAVQVRRQSLRASGSAGDFGEILMDGYSALGEWTAPRGLLHALRVRWSHDRRRGGLDEPASWNGISGEAAGEGRTGAWSLGWEGAIGYQEPYAFTWSGATRLRVSGTGWEASAGVSHDEDLPALVLGIERPSPEFGMDEHLLAYETATHPEKRTGARVEGAWDAERVGVRLGGWWASIRHYRLDSNPLWARGSLVAPLSYPEDQAEVVGTFADVRVEPVRNILGRGTARLHSRPRGDVPYLADWILDGSLHWRRLWFRGHLDLDVSLGGTIVGPRPTSRGEAYVASTLGNVEIRAVVGRGVITLSWQNVAGSFLESDLVQDDLQTPAPAAGRTFFLGLSLRLAD